MLGQRHRRWTSIEPPLDKRPLFGLNDGWAHTSGTYIQTAGWAHTSGFFEVDNETR